MEEISLADELFMRRALELAELGQGRVSPNPMVGCVIVHHGKIIGEGWHNRYGDWHAEVNAVESVSDTSILRESTVYVTLEPCSHFGKTPPCADLLIKHQVQRVVICNTDTNPLVGGKGIAKLKQAGIQVQTAILEKEGRALNKRFFTFMERRRPYIILKWAETADGFIARENYDSKWISNSLSRTLVHKWRSEEDAIMVGTNTALYDNPRLNVRDWTGHHPLRVVLDKSLRLPLHLHLFDSTHPTICYNTVKSEVRENISFVQLSNPTDNISEIVEDLYARKVQSLIVEGGSQLLSSFIEKQLWDEIRVFKSRQFFSKGIKAPLVAGKWMSSSSLAEDMLSFYIP